MGRDDEAQSHIQGELRGVIEENIQVADAEKRWNGAKTYPCNKFKSSFR